MAPFFAFLFILSTQIALAQIPLISSFGHWSDTKDINGNSPYCLNYSDDFSIIRNGLPQIALNGVDFDEYDCDDVTDRNLQSGFGFKGIKNTKITPCKEFEVGTFFHYNRPIFYQIGARKFEQMNRSTLNLDLTFGDGTGTKKTFRFVVVLTETKNGGNPECRNCQYYNLPGFSCKGCPDVPESGGPCPDYISIPNASSSEYVTINGENYLLEILGFKKDKDASILPYYLTAERCDNSAKLYAKLIKLSCISGYKYDICGQPLSGWQITVFNSTGASMGTAMTNSNGYWQVCNLLPGSYKITETIRSGWMNSNLSQNVVVLECENKTDVNFWNTPLLCISGFKKDSCTGDGIEGWLITINNSTFINSLRTGPDGYYRFCDLIPGDYTLTEETPSGYISTTPIHLDVTLTCSGNLTNQNFTNQKLLCISGFKKDACTGEGIEGWLITINNSTYINSLRTGPDGYYRFCDLLPGDYSF